MSKREAGQAFILVLIVLAIGALMVIPALRLTSTSLKSSQVVSRQTKGLYACDAAQEYVLWKLLYDGFGSVFTVDGQAIEIDLDVCGIPVDVTVVMRAVPGEGGMTLAGDDVIKPTKTVEPNYVPDKDLYDYWYTIILEQLSDNTSQGLDAIYDIPPGGITEYIGPSELSLDGGANWLPIPDPYDDELVSKGYLKWPLNYDKDTGTGNFSSHPEFLGIQDFTPRQIKMLRFRVRGRLDAGKVHCNWVVLKPWNTLSGPQAPIAVGIENPGECSGGGGLEVIKSSYPDIIPPGVETTVTYTISITNMDTPTHEIQELTDYLPPEFFYIAGSVNATSTLTTAEPLDIDLENVNGVMRQRVRWTEAQLGVSIGGGETLTLTFQARTTKDVSGSYFNEVIAILKETGLPGAAFDEAGVSPSEYGTGYSWNTGAVTVPTYDSQAEGEGITIDANMALLLQSITITSWQVR